MGLVGHQSLQWILVHHPIQYIATKWQAVVFGFFPLKSKMADSQSEIPSCSRSIHSLL